MAVSTRRHSTAHRERTDSRATLPALLARLTGALLVLAAGAIHLWLYFDFFHVVHVVGVLFLLNAAAAVLIALMLMASESPVAALAGVAFAAGTLAAFFVSVYHGLFGYQEVLRGGWQEAAGVVELAAIVVLLPLLASGLRKRSRRRR